MEGKISKAFKVYVYVYSLNILEVIARKKGYCLYSFQ